MAYLMHYNHNHDRLGRFASSPGGGSQSGKTREANPNAKRAAIEQEHKTAKKKLLAELDKQEKQELAYEHNEFDRNNVRNFYQYEKERKLTGLDALYDTRKSDLSFVPNRMSVIELTEYVSNNRSEISKRLKKYAKNYNADMELADYTWSGAKGKRRSKDAYVSFVTDRDGNIAYITPGRDIDWGVVYGIIRGDWTRF